MTHTPSRVPPTRTECPRRAELVDQLCRSRPAREHSRKSRAFWTELKRACRGPRLELLECHECGEPFALPLARVRYHNAGRYYGPRCQDVAWRKRVGAREAGG